MINGDIYSVVGNDIYIYNAVKDYGYKFSSMGRGIEPVSGKLTYLDAKVKVEVDVVSVLGNSVSKSCEVYLNGETLDVNEGVITVYKKLSERLDSVKALPTPLRIQRTEQAGLTQLVIPVLKGYRLREAVSEVLNNFSWLKC